MTPCPLSAWIARALLDNADAYERLSDEPRFDRDMTHVSRLRAEASAMRDAAAIALALGVNAALAAHAEGVRAMLVNLVIGQDETLRAAAVAVLKAN